ncbi:MAG: hypothetical protein L0Z55_06850 [Planctomycetes bacterium]|nr:hypothetical protein [Planctomycetota bacterium]
MTDSFGLPEPLHPAVVHLPLGLVLLLPLWVGLTMAAVHRRWISSRAWLGVVLLQALLFGATILAKETGEDEEERAAGIVAMALIEEHEERADLFSDLALVGIAVSLFGLFRGGVGLGAAIVTLVFSFVLLWAAARTGLTGGELVYRHGAADAYRSTAQPEPAASAPLEPEVEKK